MKKQETRNKKQTNLNKQFSISNLFESLIFVVCNLFVPCILHLGYSRRRRGSFLPVVMVSSVVFLAFATAIITLSISNVKIANLHNKRITSMSIAEAGINYSMWHLAHNNTDYCDGATCPAVNPDGSFGPFNHEYTDQAGNVLGTYDLFITPPSAGNSDTIVKAVGKVNGESPRRTVIATIGMPSFTKYTLMVNGTQLWVGPDEKITGTVLVNGSGMYNEGEVTGDASSTESTYTGWFGNQPGVAGPGIYGGAKLFPVPRIDFNQVNVDVVKIRNDAKTFGEGNYYDSSGTNGYHVILSENNYEIRRVTSYRSNKNSADHLKILSESNTGINTGTFSYPAAGILFFEDNVWVEGRINDKKITIVAADPEETNENQWKKIIIPNQLKFTNYDGRDKIGLISQKDILLPRNAPLNMEIDAAMIAKDGVIMIDSYCYPNNVCTNDKKGHIKIYGSMAHKAGLLWTTDYGNNVWSGYASTETIIDQHNVLNPPPKFPLTGTYAILSWREE